jgi:hypothetical protein
MKKVIFIILLFPVLIFSQHGMTSTDNFHYIGSHGINNDSIFARDVSFSLPLIDIQFDSINNNLVLTFDEMTYDGYSTSKNLNAIYSLNESKIVWSTLANSEKVFFKVNDNKVYHFNKEGAGLWDTKDFKFKWQIKSSLFFHPELNSREMVFAPNYKSEQKGFAGISLKDGSIKWVNDKINISSNSIIDPFIYDSFMYFINRRLHILNLNSGNYTMNDNVFNVFHENRDGSTAAAISGGLLGSLLYYAISEALNQSGNKGHSSFTRHYSNILVNNDTIYIGSREYLHKLTKEGVEIEKKMHMNERNAGISYLFNSWGSIYHISYGYSIYQDKRYYPISSKFFIQRVNNNLEILNSLDYQDVKNDQLYDFKGDIIGHKIIDDKIVLLMDHGFLSLDTNLKFTKIKYLGKRKEWEKLEKENYFYNQNGTYSLVDVSSSKDFFVKLKNGNIEEYNIAGELIKVYESKDMFYELYTDKDLKVVGDYSNTQIINAQNKHILESPGIMKVFKSKTDYIFGFRSGLFIIKLNQLVK